MHDYDDDRTSAQIIAERVEALAQAGGVLRTYLTAYRSRP